MGHRSGASSTTGFSVFTLTTSYMTNLLPHAMDHTRSVETSSRVVKAVSLFLYLCKRSWVGGYVFITHAFTISIHLPLSRTIIIPCSTNILPSFNTLFTWSIHPIRDLPLNLTLLSLILIIYLSIYQAVIHIKRVVKTRHAFTHIPLT